MMNSWIVFLKKTQGLALFICGIGLNTPSFAQIDNDLFELSLEELSSIRVSGVAKKDESLKTTAASVNVFDQATIRRLGASTLLELIPYTTGFQTIRSADGNQTTVATRGRITASANREILLIIDGVRQDSWRNGGSISNTPHISLVGVDKVEFIRGAVSHLYGANAFLGVINIVTVKPTGDTKNAFIAETGSDLAHRFGIHANKISGEFQHSFIADLTRDQGQTYTVLDAYEDRETKISDPFQSYSLTYRPSYKNTTLNFSQRSYEFDEFYILGTTSKQFSNLEHVTRTIGISHQLEISTKFNGSINLAHTSNENISSGVQYTGVGDLSTASSPSSEAPLVLKTDVSDYSYWAQAEGRFTITEMFSYFSEIEYRKQKINVLKLFNNYDTEALLDGTLPVTYYGDFDEFTLGAPEAEDHLYGFSNQIEFQSKQIHLNLGVRYDHSKFGSDNFSPRFSAVYELSDTISIKSIYSEAYRPPTGNELFLVNNPFFLGSENLEAETVKTSELIWFFQNGNQQIEFGLYSNRFDDQINIVTLTNGTRVFQNIESSESSGIESLLIQPLSQHLSLRLSYAHSLNKSDDMYRLADNNGTLSMNFNYQNINANFAFKYVGERAYLNSTTNNITPIDSYILINGFISYSHKDFEFDFSIENLADKSYFHPSFGSSNQAVPARGMSANFGVCYKF